MSKAGLPEPEFDFNGSFFVTLYDKTYLKEKVGVGEGLVESQKRILSLISENPRISKQELAKKIGISTTAVDKNIIKLKQKGLLKRIGPAKGGYWEINE